MNHQFPSTDNQINSPAYRQAGMSNNQTCLFHHIFGLGIGIWLLFGAWDLVIGS